MIGIYKITNTLNHRVYIGKSKNCIRRKYQHFRKLKLNKHKNVYLQNSYNKHGKALFNFEVIETCDIEALSEREFYHYNLFKDNSYNIAEVTLETYIVSNATKHKMKCSNTSKKIIYSYCIETNEYNKWDSIKECSTSLGLTRRVIQRILKNEKLTYKGYSFGYNKEDIENNIKLKNIHVKTRNARLSNIFRKIDESEYPKIKKLYLEGNTQLSIGQLYNVSNVTIHKILKKY